VEVVMSKGRFGAVAALLALVVLGGLVTLAPTLHGQQVQVFKSDDGPGERRIVEVVAGPGQQIGVSVRDADQADAKREQVSGSGGAVVDEVRAGSPAEKAGFKAGDVIVSFDGERVRSARQLRRLIEETPPGRQVKAGVVRGGKPMDLVVAPEKRDQPMTWVAPDLPDLTREVERSKRDVERELERAYREGQRWRVETPEVHVFRGGPNAFEFVMQRGRLGVGVLDLSPELAQHFGAKQGVLVNTVAADSAAAKAGIKVGDVITSVNGKPVDDAGELRESLWDDEAATKAKVGVVRGGKEMTLEVTLEELKLKHQAGRERI
jgi:S1-C subfamily serine protease